MITWIFKFLDCGICVYPLHKLRYCDLPWGHVRSPRWTRDRPANAASTWIFANTSPNDPVVSFSRKIFLMSLLWYFLMSWWYISRLVRSEGNPVSAYEYGRFSYKERRRVIQYSAWGNLAVWSWIFFKFSNDTSKRSETSLNMSHPQRRREKKIWLYRKVPLSVVFRRSLVTNLFIVRQILTHKRTQRPPF